MLGGLVLLRLVGADLFSDLVVRGLAVAVAIAGVMVLAGRSRGRTNVGLIVILLMGILLALAGIMTIQGKW